ncbi:DUF2798 domain-containing protein [Telluribacter humicola]|uniref:DUF2798 domain-containing protein n=1 Tax=Telluribacter humicola TaxID=1720261 RepID=UPI0021D4804F|nr:DUF2798 domain-containing protein [Telluribacter humicola]
MTSRYLKFINTLFVVLPMTLLMAFVGIVRNHGFHEGWFELACKAWSVMFPVAYIAAFFIIPVAKRLAEKVTAR